MDAINRSSGIEKIVQAELTEDIGKGDVTMNRLGSGDVLLEGTIRTRQNMILAGIDPALSAFSALDPNTVCDAHQHDGAKLARGDVIARIRCRADALLGAERTALNLLQILSAIATTTARYVARIKDTQAQLLDTRKTLPGLRRLSKHAVRVGGGVNHRMGLDDGILIKDNHIALAGGIAEAIDAVRRQGKSEKIMIECDHPNQARQALDHGADWILLDNMDCAELSEVVKFCSGDAVLEASGNVNLDNIRKIALTGVHYISSSAITLSAGIVDIGLDIP